MPAQHPNIRYPRPSAGDCAEQDDSPWGPSSAVIRRSGALARISSFGTGVGLHSSPTRFHDSDGSNDEFAAAVDGLSKVDVHSGAP